MSTINEAEYWKTRKQVREDILTIRNELLDIVARKSVIERRLEQMQNELAVLNSALLNEAYYLRLGYADYALDAPNIYDTPLIVHTVPVPFGSYRDASTEGEQPVQLFGHERTVEGFQRVAMPETVPELTHHTGRYITDALGKTRYLLDDRVLAALLQQDPESFRRITRKDAEGQILIQGEFGIVPSYQEAAPGRIYADEAEYYGALARYYTDMSKLAGLKGREQHTAA
ncbi:hypothetical protein F1C16_10995 [Hymenobacter sp. NBH84]|uniref:hypothetical protein n=1 Tax=Hymenobacter sp. NBH84 TaxID=2596915 RepID=UPI0016247735|nr:hypothetical protein [Hymenobacter sp. NBH84]QNE40050.1 hypothetical protein F1C16_10995 [Hymenobacter sp. NBH84]